MAIERRFLDVRLTIDGVVTTPTKDVVGTQYLVAATGATGIFAGHENQIAYRAASGWKFYKNVVGQMELFSLSDNRIYRYEEGVNGNPPSWGVHKFGSGDEAITEADKRIKAPVLAVINAFDSANSETLPATCEAGEKYIDVATGKVYTATDVNTWDAGVDATEGDRYAALNTGKIYVANDEGKFESSTIEDGAIFVSKRDDNIYTYDADLSTFRNLTSVKDRPEYKKHTVTVTHVVSATEVTAKSFTLPKLAVLGDGVLVSVGGVVQTPVVDYAVTNANGVSTLSWVGLGLEDIALIGEVKDTNGVVTTVGDVFVISYNTEAD